MSAPKNRALDFWVSRSFESWMQVRSQHPGCRAKSRTSDHLRELGIMPGSMPPPAGYPAVNEARTLCDGCGSP